MDINRVNDDEETQLIIASRLFHISYNSTGIFHYYITVKSVCVSPLPKFELNQIGHNSVNFEATASRFCMEEDLEEEDEVEEVDDNDDDDTSKNVFFCIFYILFFLRFLNFLPFLCFLHFLYFLHF